MPGARVVGETREERRRAAVDRRGLGLRRLGGGRHGLVQLRQGADIIARGREAAAEVGPRRGLQQADVGSMSLTSCSGPSGTPPNIGGGAGRVPRAVSFASSLSLSLSLSAIMRPATRGRGGTGSLAAASAPECRRRASSNIRITSPRRPGLASSAGGVGGAAGEASSEVLRLGGNRTSKRESSVARWDCRPRGGHPAQ